MKIVPDAARRTVGVSGRTHNLIAGLLCLFGLLGWTVPSAHAQDTYTVVGLVQTGPTTGYADIYLRPGELLERRPRDDRGSNNSGPSFFWCLKNGSPPAHSTNTSSRGYSSTRFSAVRRVEESFTAPVAPTNGAGGLLGNEKRIIYDAASGATLLEETTRDGFGRITYHGKSRTEGRPTRIEYRNVSEPPVPCRAAFPSRPQTGVAARLLNPLPDAVRPLSPDDFIHAGAERTAFGLVGASGAVGVVSIRVFGPAAAAASLRSTGAAALEFAPYSDAFLTDAGASAAWSATLAFPAGALQADRTEPNTWNTLALVRFRSTERTPGVPAGEITIESGSVSSTVAVRNSPPPLLLVHGIWATSTPQDWRPLLAALGQRGSPRVIGYANYPNVRSFLDDGVQQALATAIRTTLSRAWNQGIVAPQVDVVAHSMGALGVRGYAMETTPGRPYRRRSNMMRGDVASIVSINTPHEGSALASTLLGLADRRLDQSLVPSTRPAVKAYLNIAVAQGQDTLARLMANQKRPVDQGGVAALSPGSDAYARLSQGPRPGSSTAQSLRYHAVRTAAPATSWPEDFFNAMFAAAQSPGTVDTLLAAGHDTVVSSQSQASGADGVKDFNGPVHASIPSVGRNRGEGVLESPEVAAHVACRLDTGADCPAAASALLASVAPNEVDLGGKSEAPAGTIRLDGPDGPIRQGAKARFTLAASTGRTLGDFEIRAMNGSRETVIRRESLSNATTFDFAPTETGDLDFIILSLLDGNQYGVATANWQVTPPAEVLSLSFDPEEGDLNAPDAAAALPLRLTALSTDGNEIDVTGSATFETLARTNPVGAVMAGGWLQPLREGLGTVEASYAGKTATLRQKVGDGPDAAPAGSLLAATLPSSRSVRVGQAATGFVSLLNNSTVDLTGCRIAARDAALPAAVSFQTTNPATNALDGRANRAADIPPGGVQSFLVALTPSAAFPSREVELRFSCDNTTDALSIIGANTLALSSSTGPVADIIAVTATLTGDGVANIPSANGTGLMTVAAANVGIGDDVEVTGDTGASGLGLPVFVCETDATGACKSPPASKVTLRIGAGATPTFSLFVQGAGRVVAFNPGVNRLFVRFRSAAGGELRGSTSVAIRTLG